MSIKEQESKLRKELIKHRIVFLKNIGEKFDLEDVELDMDLQMYNGSGKRIKLIRGYKNKVIKKTKEQILKEIERVITSFFNANYKGYNRNEGIKTFKSYLNQLKKRLK